MFSIIKIKLIAVFLTLFMLTACGGGSTNADEESAVMDAADEVMDAADEVIVSQPETDSQDNIFTTISGIWNTTDFNTNFEIPRSALEIREDGSWSNYEFLPQRALFGLTVDEVRNIITFTDEELASVGWSQEQIEAFREPRDCWREGAQTGVYTHIGDNVFEEVTFLANFPDLMGLRTPTIVGEGVNLRFFDEIFPPILDFNICEQTGS